MKIEIGSRVRYSAEWLRSTGQYTGSVPFARGNVAKIENVGTLQLATVFFDDDETPFMVNVKNLERCQ